MGESRHTPEICGSRWPPVPSLARCMLPKGHAGHHNAVPSEPTGWAWPQEEKPGAAIKAATGGEHSHPIVDPTGAVVQPDGCTGGEP